MKNSPPSGGGGGGSSGSSRRDISNLVFGTTTSNTSSTTGEVLGVETFKFLINLHIGMRSNDVTELQKRLRAEGYFTYPTNTGYFGPITKAAVQAYQAAHGIEATGFVGPLTRAELNK